MKLYEISEAYLRVANTPDLTDEEKKTLDKLSSFIGRKKE